MVNINWISDGYYKNKKRNIRKLSDVFNDIGLPKAAKKKRLIDREIIEIWSKHIDQDIRDHGNVTGVRDGVITVEVDSTAWLHHLSNFCKCEILDVFQNKSSKIYIDDVKFKLISG